MVLDTRRKLNDEINDLQTAHVKIWNLFPLLQHFLVCLSPSNENLIVYIKSYLFSFLFIFFASHQPEFLNLEGEPVTEMVPREASRSCSGHRGNCGDRWKGG